VNFMEKFNSNVNVPKNITLYFTVSVTRIDPN